jgi:hypothetical protein
MAQSEFRKTLTIIKSLINLLLRIDEKIKIL